MEVRASYYPTIDFSHTAFNQLMQKRIRTVLIISSNYDFFMLEEDGRIDEQIFNEYVSLNLRYPPIFVKATNAAEAFRILEEEDIDLVIEMLNLGRMMPLPWPSGSRKNTRRSPSWC